MGKNVQSHITKDGKLHINQNDSLDIRDRVYKQWNNQQVSKQLKNNPVLKKQLISDMKTLGSKVLYKQNKSGIPTSKINVSGTSDRLLKTFMDSPKNKAIRTMGKVLNVVRGGSAIGALSYAASSTPVGDATIHKGFKQKEFKRK